MKNLTGKRFGKLVVLGLGERKNGVITWKCKCDCGNINNVFSYNLTMGRTKSCGCNTVKGLTYSGIRDSYYNMRKRCLNPNNKSYKNYGDRGITICKKWMTYKGFLDDMLGTYKEGLTLDRINVNDGYYKENCRWVTMKIQNNNRRNNHCIRYNGENLTLMELSEKYNVKYDLLKERLYRGLSIEYCLKDVKEKEMIEYKGVKKTVTEFAKEYNMTYHQLKKRLMRSWTVERALTQPLRKRNCSNFTRKS